MPQQPQSTSQYIYGPASGGAGDILHFGPANSNPVGGSAFIGWLDKNGLFGGVQGVASNALANGPAATITSATGGVFSVAATGVQATAALPGGSAFEQLPFIVKVSGLVVLAAGTYTATVQPLLYASTTAGFTAAAASAIYSAAAASITVTSATALSGSWELECHLNGDSTSGKLVGWQVGSGFVTGTTLAASLIAVAASPSSNAPTSINFAATTPPLSFAAGVTLGQNAPATSTVSLGSLFIYA
jgi:hypothetical protein